MRVAGGVECLVSHMRDGLSVRHSLMTDDEADSASVDLPLSGKMTGALDVDLDGSYSRDYRVLDGDVSPPLPSWSSTGNPSFIVEQSLAIMDDQRIRVLFLFVGKRLKNFLVFDERRSPTSCGRNLPGRGLCGQVPSPVSI